MTLSINDVKQCPVCQEWKILEEFPKNAKGAKGRDTYCGPCHKARCRARTKRDRAKIYDILGGRCSCCRWDDADYLDVDHVHDDGYLDRQQNNGHRLSTRQLLKLVRSHPERFQLLCVVCHRAKTRQLPCVCKEVFQVWTSPSEQPGVTCSTSQTPLVRDVDGIPIQKALASGRP